MFLDLVIEHTNSTTKQISLFQADQDRQSKNSCIKMAGWIAANQKSKPRFFERIEKDVGYVLSPKSTLNLMQNCDLPPPIKLFSGPDGAFLSSISKVYSMGGGLEAEDEVTRTYKDCSGDDKLEVLKALRLSQTRAREAERKLGVLSKEKDTLVNLLVDESMRLFAHRQWINLLELEVLKLQRQQQKENRECYYSVSNFAGSSSKREDHDEGSSGKKWCAAIAFCLAIAGMGYAFGCRYIF